MTIAPTDLQQAIAALEAEGFQTDTPPPHLLAQGVALLAHREADGEGFVLTPSELRLIAHYGSTAPVDPYRAEEPKPRYEREGTKDRVKAYAEAALARIYTEARTALKGNRNNTLARAAWQAGKFAANPEWGLNVDLVEGELIDAGLSTGLGQREVEATVKRILTKASQNPKEVPPDLRYTPPFREPGSTLNQSRPGQQNPDLGNLGSHSKAPSLNAGIPKLGGA